MSIPEVKTSLPQAEQIFHEVEQTLHQVEPINTPAVSKFQEEASVGMDGKMIIFL